MVGEKDPVLILDALRPLYGEGVYPGRSDRRPRPKWMDSPFHVLIATVLSQRTRDENTRQASDSLFGTFPTVESLAEAETEEIQRLIVKAGFPVQKAKAIKMIATLTQHEHGGILPADMEVLLGMPMVGRKTANCVLAYAFGIPAICVDTHVHRISNLIGMVHSRDPDETESQLRETVPDYLWKDINALMVRHGQVICLPRRPKCQECPVRPHCDHGSSPDR